MTNAAGTGTPTPAPIAGQVATYSDYLERGFSAIPSDAWDAAEARARKRVLSITRGLAQAVYDDAAHEYREQVVDALCEAADAMKAVSEAVTSEKLGSYAVTYARAAQGADIANAVIDALRDTDLCYSGVWFG